MSVTAEALRLMFQAGLSPDQVVAIAAALECGAIKATSSAADRQRRYRERKASERNGDATSDENHNERVTTPSPSLFSPPDPPSSPTPLPGEYYAHVKGDDLAVDGDITEGDDLDWIGPVAAPAAKPKTKRGTRLPADWTPSETDAAYAADRGFTPEEVDRIAEDFRDYWTARAGAGGTKLDWPATWRTRIRERADRRGQSMASGPTRSGGFGQGGGSFAEIVARRRGFATG